MDYQYKSQNKAVENSIERHFRKLWRLANILEKSQPERSHELRKQYWKELRTYKQSYIGIK